MEKKQVPAIRFQGFTDAWEQRKLGELGTVQTCKRIFKEQTSEQGDIPFFKNGTIGLEPDSYISREVYEEFRRLYPYPEVGDTLISVVGSIGRTAEYVGKDEYFQDSNVVWLKTDGSINKKFLKTSYQVIKWLIEGSTVKHLYNDNILRSEIVMPVSQIEQAKIAEFFEELDHLITLHQRKYEKLLKVKKSMLEKMFPRDGADVPEIRFDGFTDAWEQRKVSDMFKVTRGYVLAATLTNDTKSDEMPYPVYSSQTKDFGLMGYYRDYLYENSITWTTDGANAGTVNYRAGKFYCTNVCGVLLSDKVNASQMIAEALNNVAKGYVSYVGNPKLMNNVMSDIEIMIPVSPMEQKRISDYFATLDHLITLHQRKLEKLTNIKKSLLEKMFV